MTTLATTASLSIAYGIETAWGTPPVAAFQTLRVTADAMETVTSTIKAIEIVGSREVQDIIRTEVYGKGSLNFFLSYGNLDDLLTGVFQAAWSSNVIIPGSTFTSFTLEKHFADVSLFHAYKGAVVDTFTLDVKVGAAIAGSMGFLSQSCVAGSATLGSGAYTAAPTNPVMQTVDYIQLMKEGGSAIANVTELSLSIKNNMRTQLAIGQATPIGMGTGMFEVDGTMIAFFATDALLSEYLAGTSSSIEVTLGGLGSKEYDILMSKLRYTKCAILGKAPNSDIMVELSFSAYFDATNHTMKITRTP